MSGCEDTTATAISIPEGAKLIPLTKGKFAIVDAEDYPTLSRFRWKFNQGYALRSVRINEVRTTQPMHRDILDAPKGLCVDHINGDPLDNRRCNLRLCTRQQNNWNRKSLPNSASRYVGVSRGGGNRVKQWRACVTVNGKGLTIGHFLTEIEAAQARDVAAKKYYGEFAKLNFPE